MKKFIIIPFTAIGLFISCEFSKSMNKDLISGLTTTGSGLSCGEVFLSSNKERINRHSFIYGEKIHLSFDDISGFEKKDGYAFPGLRMTVLSQAGDTILNYPDLYSDNVQGFKLAPLALSTNLVIAEPLHSSDRYKLLVDIWDKNGKGTFSVSMDFDIKSNDQIKVESTNFTSDEIYLYSKAQEKVLTGNFVNKDEDIYMIFEGLRGFQHENGSAFLGLSLTARDATGKLILDEPDLIGDAKMDYNQVSSQLAPSFIFTGTDIKNPVTCEVKIWDKMSKNSINAQVSLNIQQ